MGKGAKKIVKKPNLTAKLTFFDWGWADNVVFSLKAKVTEKYKGLIMIDRVKAFFGITNKEIVNNEKENIEKEMADIEESRDKSTRDRWTRDEGGNIVSPFKTKKWT